MGMLCWFAKPSARALACSRRSLKGMFSRRENMVIEVVRGDAGQVS